MLTAFARFGERAATIVPQMPGIEGGQTARKGVRGSGGLLSMQQRRPVNVYAASAAGAGARLYLPAAILLINSSTRQLSCSFS
jgi:hypothetical protein